MYVNWHTYQIRVFLLLLYAPDLYIDNRYLSNRHPATSSLKAIGYRCFRFLPRSFEMSKCIENRWHYVSVQALVLSNCNGPKTTTVIHDNKHNRITHFFLSLKPQSEVVLLLCGWRLFKSKLCILLWSREVKYNEANTLFRPRDSVVVRD